MYVGIMLASGVFILYAIYTNWNNLISQQWEFNYPYILLAILVYPIGMLPTVTAWHTLLHALGEHLPFRTNLRLYSLSTLSRHVPGFVMFVTSRSLLYQERNVPAAITIAATGAETILLAITGGITSILLLLLGGGAVQRFESFRYAAIFGVLILLAFVTWTPTLNRLLSKVLTNQKIERIPQLEQKRVVASLVWMFIAWTGGGLVLFTLTQAIQPVPWTMFPMFVGMWGAAGAVSLTIGIAVMGLGLREITLGALLTLVIPPISAIVIAIAFRLIMTIGELLWVMLFAWLTRNDVPQR